MTLPHPPPGGRILGEGALGLCEQVCNSAQDHLAALAPLVGTARPPRRRPKTEPASSEA